MADRVSAQGSAAETIERFQGVGLSSASQADAAALRTVPGPLPPMSGVTAPRRAAADEPVTLELALDEPMGARGSVMFWLRLDRTQRAGLDAPSEARVVLEAPDAFAVSTNMRPAAFGLWWLWDDVAGALNMRTLLPGLPGPGWYHVAYAWDAEAGLFDAYLNGTPMRLPGTAGEPWDMPRVERMVVHLEHYAIAGLKVGDRMLDAEAIGREVTQLYAGSVDRLLGARPLGAVDLDARKGELLYANALAAPTDVSDWVMEGPGVLRFEGGWMRMASERPDGPEGHFVHWCPEVFGESYIAEWEVQPISEHGLCIVFFSAQGRDGRDLFDPSLAPREGVFARYHSGDIDSYHISYYANTPSNPGRISANMRKNSGFYLVTNGPPGIAPGSRAVHRVQLIKDASRIQLAVDGELTIDFVDDGETFGPVHGGGRIGLRQMQWMEAQYRNFRVHAVR